MNFLSIEFLWLLLPASAICVALTNKYSTPTITGLTVIAFSIIFYVSSGWLDLSFLLLSIFLNYGFVHLIQNCARKELYFYIAILLNLVFLTQFKYYSLANLFFHAQPDGVLATNNWIRLLGASYFTFQQVTVLIQVRDDNKFKLGFLDYLQFVCFFPTLVSGPIARMDEVAESFKGKRDINPLTTNIGLALVCIGLIKKVFIADTLGHYVDRVFDAGPGPMTICDAWIGAVGFTFQVFFDFSGYSDMAIGFAKLLGITLPINFIAPYRSLTIAEFWRRWHMTMTRFFSDFVYAPIAISLTRIGTTRSWNPAPMFVCCVGIPTILTFVLVGFWHEAGVNFLLFGLLHGIALTGFQLWRKRSRRRLPRSLSFVLTFLFLIMTLVLFRAKNFDVTKQLWTAMLGGDLLVNSTSFLSLTSNGPGGWMNGVGDLLRKGNLFAIRENRDIVFSITLLIAGTLCFVVPDTIEFMRGYAAGLTGRTKVDLPWSARWIRWNPSIAWSIGLGLAGGLAYVVALKTGLTQFIYIRF